MDGQLRERVAEDLARGAEQFLKWRRSRAVGARIPAALWQSRNTGDATAKTGGAAPPFEEPEPSSSGSANRAAKQ